MRLRRSAQKERSEARVCQAAGGTIRYEIPGDSLSDKPFLILTVISTAQVETLLKGQDPDTTQRALPQSHDNAFSATLTEESILSLPDISGLAEEMDGPMPTANAAPTSQSGQIFFPCSQQSTPNDPSWDLISLGLEEPLPTQDVIDELFVT